MPEDRELTLLEDAAAYPLRGSGWIMILTGAVLSALLGPGSLVPEIRFAGWGVGCAYFTAFYFEIITSTVNGSDECPDWPEITDLLGDIIMPAIRCAGVSLIAFLPLTLILFRMDPDSNPLTNPAVWAGLAFGAFYFPMAILNVAVGNEMSGALPHRVFPDAIRAMPGYWWMAGLLAAAFVLSHVAAVYSSRVPFIGGLIGAGISLYFMMMQARLGALFYRRRLETEAEQEDETEDSSVPGQLPPVAIPEQQMTKELAP